MQKYVSKMTPMRSWGTLPSATSAFMPLPWPLPPQRALGRGLPSRSPVLCDFVVCAQPSCFVCFVCPTQILLLFISIPRKQSLHYMAPQKHKPSRITLVLSLMPLLCHCHQGHHHQDRPPPLTTTARTTHPPFIDFCSAACRLLVFDTDVECDDHGVDVVIAFGACNVSFSINHCAIHKYCRCLCCRCRCKRQEPSQKSTTRLA